MYIINQLVLDLLDAIQDARKTDSNAVMSNKSVNELERNIKEYIRMNGLKHE